jgi:dTDP-4-amino-4,6-dideoxygalactose transaminase
LVTPIEHQARDPVVDIGICARIHAFRARGLYPRSVTDPDRRPHDSVPLTRPSLGPEELAAIEQALTSGWVAGQGPFGAELERLVAERSERRHAVAVNSCTAGLHLALRAMDVGAGDEVVVPDYTYPATAYAVLHCGATPVVADVDEQTGCLDPEAARAAVTGRTRVVVGVDPLGLCADWDALTEVAAECGVRLLADAACSLGATYSGRPAGAFGDAAVFSLHARKGATSGEGGVVVTDDDHLAAQIRAWSCFGQRSAWERSAESTFTPPVFDDLGWNYKLSDILAAVGVVQVRRLDALLAARRAAAARYADLLVGIEGVVLPRVAPGREHAWQTYAVTLAPGLPRDRIVDLLRADGVGSTMGTYDLRSQPVFGEVDSDSAGRRLARSHLALPMFSDITEDQQRWVAEALRRAVVRTT